LPQSALTRGRLRKTIDPSLARCGTIARVSPGSFEATSAELDGIRAVEVSGELDLGTAPDLEGPLDEAVAAGEPLLIDLSACEFIDSTGIALIVRAWQRLGGEEANGDGHRVAICSANAQVRRVLQITGLEHSIPLRESRDEALATLRG
jgi:anti-sigma B factor antagonist